MTKKHSRNDSQVGYVSNVIMLEFDFHMMTRQTDRQTDNVSEL